ncbi:MAG: S41 family peptidase [Planctomycetaceae bacterium]
MTTRPSFILSLMLTTAMVVTSAAQAQYSDTGYGSGYSPDYSAPSYNNGSGSYNPYHPSGYGTDTQYQPAPGLRDNRDIYPATFSPDYGYGDGRDNFRPVQDDLRYNSYGDFGNGTGYGSDPLNPAPRDSRQWQGRRSGRARGDAGGTGWDRIPQDSLADPFRSPAGSGNVSGPRYDFISRDNSLQDDLYRDPSAGSLQERYRVPLDRTDFGRPALNDDGLFPASPGRTDWNRPTSPARGLDPFTPAPLPQRDGADEASDIDKMLTARYPNPTTIRSVRSMSTDQAVQLYREVSKQTDQRHLEPSSYDLRVRRAIRNLGMALDNRAFVQGLGISADSFRTDAFRNSLSRIYESMQVRNMNDAERVMQAVMQEAQSVPGLGPNVVAFEFTNATIDTLDKFSALEPADPNRGAALETETKSAGLESEIVGIGVEVKEHADGLLLMKTLRDGPAAEIGLQAGDIITAIDGRSIGGMPMASSVDLMKGPSGSSIRLQVFRKGFEAREATLVRRRIRVWTVNDMKMLSGTDSVAYLSLSQFGQTSTQELDDALQQLYRQGMKSVILDLRGNPGGLLNVCVDITNRFLPCGTIVSTKGRLSSDNMLETATFERTWSNPLVVLIDGDSASASEIFAAAIQENQRGIIVGDKSYGKGTVQTHFPLQTVSGNLRLTTARFYSPNGRPMSGSGVTPDVRVIDEDGPANGDRVLEEAVRIAQSQRLQDMASAAGKCRNNNTATPLLRNSFNDSNRDCVKPQTVLR